MIFIIGYGNPLRSDDGIGIFVANCLSQKNLTGIKIMTAHQLHVEFLDEAVRYKATILIDASSQQEDVSFRKIESSGYSQIPSTRHLTPELFFELGKAVYGKDLNLYLCSLKGECFEIGHIFSDLAYQRAQKAIEQIYSFVQGDLIHA